MAQEEEKSLTERAFERIDVRAELPQLISLLNELRVQYEQYFLGVSPLPPDKLHNDYKRLRRRLLDAPFKNSEMGFRLRAVENRYQTYHTYWERIQKQREDGTYSKDVFKANLRERRALEDAHASTAEGAAERGMVSLFNAYKMALEKQTGKVPQLDFKAFHTSLIQRAKDLKAKTGAEKLSFKVLVKNGKVTVQAKAKK